MNESADRRATAAYVVCVTVLAAVGTWYLALRARWLSYAIRAGVLMVLASSLFVLGHAIRNRALLEQFDLHRSIAATATTLLGAVVAFVLAAYVRYVLPMDPPTFVATVVVTVVLLLPVAVRWRRRSAAQTERAGTGRKSQVALALLLLTGVALVGHDVTGADVTYDATTFEPLELHGHDDGEPEGVTVQQLVVMRLHVRNDFAHARPVDLPRYDLCVVGDDEGVVRSATPFRTATLGIFDERIEGDDWALLKLRAEIRHRLGPDESIRLDVERGRDCEVEREQPTIRFWKTAEHRPISFEVDSGSSGTGDRNASATG